MESDILDRFRTKLVEAQSLSDNTIQALLQELTAESGPNAEKLASVMKLASGEIAE